MRRRLQTVALVAILALLVAIPTYVIATFDSTALPARLTTETEPSIGQVDVTEVQRSGSAQLFIDWRTPVVLSAPEWDGLVTDVLLEPRTRLTNGTAIVAIDGVRRIAVGAPTPWFRVLTTGDSGPDVRHLQDALDDLGYLETAVAKLGDWDSATAAAVQLLAADLGAEPTSEEVMFDPAWFVWLAPESTGALVASVHMEIAAPAPVVGEPLATGEPAATAIRAESSTLDLSGRSVWTITGSDDGSTLASAAEFDEGTASPQTVATVAAAIGAPDDSDRSEVPVQLSEPGATRVARVPPSAWIRTTDGEGCVWARSSPSEPWSAVRFGGYNGDLGVGVTDDQVVVDALAGDEVLLNADDVLEDVSCP